MPDFDDDDLDNADLPASLRKQLKAKDKALDELKAQYEQVLKRDRERTLSDALTAKGLPSKVAKLLPSDLDPTPEAIDGWLSEYADVFGIKQETPVEEPPAVPDAYKRLQALSSQTSSEGGEQAVLHSITSAATEADLLKMILDAGGGAL